MRIEYVVLIGLAWLALPTGLLAQESLGVNLAVPPLPPEQPPSRPRHVPPSPSIQDAPPPTAAVDPWGRRPVCASMFLKGDWQLSGKQRACDWVRNRLLSNVALLGAAWSAGVSQARDASAERGDAFAVRFGRRLAQSALKSSAAYVASLTGEDLRAAPPYLAMSARARPRGFWKRTGHALSQNVVAYRCVADCSRPEHIRRRVALAPGLGAVASGYGSEMWTWDRETSHQRALRGAAAAYGSTFLNAWVTEFKPEISAFAGRTFGSLFGFR